MINKKIPRSYKLIYIFAGILAFIILGFIATFSVAFFTSKNVISGTVVVAGTNEVVWLGADNEEISGFAFDNAYLPGNSVDQTLKIKFGGGTTNCFLRVKIVGVNKDIEYDIFDVNTNSNWENVGEYYYYVGTTNAEAVAGQIIFFGDKITVANDMGNELRNKYFQIKIVAEVEDASDHADSSISFWANAPQNWLNKSGKTLQTSESIAVRSQVLRHAVIYSYDINNTESFIFKNYSDTKQYFAMNLSINFYESQTAKQIYSTNDLTTPSYLLNFTNPLFTTINNYYVITRALEPSEQVSILVKNLSIKFENANNLFYEVKCELIPNLQITDEIISAQRFSTTVSPIQDEVDLMSICFAVVEYDENYDIISNPASPVVASTTNINFIKSGDEYYYKDKLYSDFTFFIDITNAIDINHTYKLIKLAHIERIEGIDVTYANLQNFKNAPSSWYDCFEVKAPVKTSTINTVTRRTLPNGGATINLESTEKILVKNVGAKDIIFYFEFIIEYYNGNETTALPNNYNVVNVNFSQTNFISNGNKYFCKYILENNDEIEIIPTNIVISTNLYENTQYKVKALVVCAEYLENNNPFDSLCPSNWFSTLQGVE